MSRFGLGPQQQDGLEGRPSEIEVLSDKIGVEDANNLRAGLIVGFGDDALVGVDGKSAGWKLWIGFLGVKQGEEPRECRLARVVPTVDQVFDAEFGRASWRRVVGENAEAFDF